MRSIIRAIRQQFHPLHYARKSAMGRLVLRVADRPAWISVPEVDFRVRGRLLSHGVAYGLIGSQERNPEALAIACLQHFKFRSFWDVGANFGYFSWLLKSAVADLHMVLIEPLPGNAKLIRETIQRNRFSDVHLIEAGVSAHSGEGVLHADVLAGLTSSLNDGETFEQRHFRVAPKLISVPLISIDSVRGEHDPIDFMKIDVEGHEAASLQGAAGTIARDHPVLFIECNHPEHECLKLLDSGGYRTVDADSLSIDCSGSSTNFFCFPPRLHQSIQAVLQLAKGERSGPE